MNNVARVNNNKSLEALASPEKSNLGVMQGYQLAKAEVPVSINKTGKPIKDAKALNAYITRKLTPRWPEELAVAIERKDAGEVSSLIVRGAKGVKLNSSFGELFPRDWSLLQSFTLYDWGWHQRFTPLSLACKKAGNARIVELLLGNGAKVGRNLNKLVTFSCLAGDAKVLQILLQQHNTDAGTEVKFNYSDPIRDAALRGYCDCVKLLVDHHCYGIKNQSQLGELIEDIEKIGPSMILCEEAKLDEVMQFLKTHKLSVDARFPTSTPIS